MNHVKRSGMSTIPLSDINHGFWSHLGQTPLVLARKVSFRVFSYEIMKVTLPATLSSGIFKALNRVGDRPRLASSMDLYQIFRRPLSDFTP